MSIWDKQTALFNDYRNREIALWKTLDEEVAIKEQATFESDQLKASLTRDSLHYRLTHPPVIIHNDKRYGGLIGMDAFEVTNDEDAAIDYKNRNDEYLRDLKSLTPTRELMKKKLSLQRDNAELFEKLGDIWSETIPNLDHELSEAIINNAQPAGWPYPVQRPILWATFYSRVWSPVTFVSQNIKKQMNEDGLREILMIRESAKNLITDIAGPDQSTEFWINRF